MSKESEFMEMAKENSTPKKKSLYGITSEYQNLINQIMDNEGEITEEIEQFLAINQKDLKSKSRNYIAVINNQTSDVDFIDKEINRLQAIKKAKSNIILRLKESIKNAMLMYSVDEIDTKLNKIKLRNSESINITDIEKLPSSVITIKKSASKAEIKKLLKSGTEVNGAEIVINPSINIK